MTCIKINDERGDERRKHKQVTQVIGMLMTSAQSSLGFPISRVQTSAVLGKQRSCCRVTAPGASFLCLQHFCFFHFVDCFLTCQKVQTNREKVNLDYVQNVRLRRG